MSSEHSDGHGSVPQGGSRAIAVESARLTLRAIAHSWPALLAISFLTVLIGGLAEMGAAEFTRLALPAEFGWVHQWFPSRQYSILGIEIAAVRTILEGAAFAIGFGAVAVVTAAAVGRERVNALSALAHSGRRLLALTATYLAFGLIAILLAVVSVPLLLLAPIGLPAAVIGIVLWFMRPARRRLAGWMIVLGLPFGLLVQWAVLLAVALPAVAVDGDGPIESLGTSRRLVAGRWWQAALTVAGTAIAVVLSTLGVGLILTALAAMTQPSPTAAAPSWLATVYLVLSVVVSQVPAVALTALYLVLRDRPTLGIGAVGEAAPRRSPALGFGTAAFMRRARPLTVASLVALVTAAVVPPGGAVMALAASAHNLPCGGAPVYSASSVQPVTTTAPQTLLVTSPTDAALPLPGTLRYAINQANASSGASTITFGISGTIFLVASLNLTGAATIDGGAHAVILDGQSLYPILTTGTNAVTINNLTLSHGSANPCTQNSLAGGVTSSGPATFNHVNFDSNSGGPAGALHTWGPTTINNSTFTNNTGFGVGTPVNPAGGALTTNGPVTAKDSTFVLNTGSPAASPSPPGGAIYIHSGASFNGNGLTIVRSTGGGIVWLSGGLSLSNSMLDSNNNGDCFGFGTPPGSGNADSDGSCGGGSVMTPSGYDQNPALHGTSTPTILLFPGSGAIGHGNSASCLARDQNGVLRPAGGCSSGAYQFRPQVNVAFSTDQPTYGYSTNVLMTAVITPVYEPSPVQLVAVGDVTFYDGATPLGPASSISGNTANFGFSTLAIGPHTLTAHYNGQLRSFAASVSSGVGITVTGSLSIVSVASSLNPSTIGDAVLFTASLSSGLPASATGTIRFFDGATLLSSPAVANDAATFTTGALATGHHSITVQYSGDSTHGPATSAPLDQAVRDFTTSVATAVSPRIFGTPLVQVTVTSPTGIPSGFVDCQFGNQGVSAVLDGTGHATCDGSIWTPGSGNVTASYRGDALHAPSSTTVALSVNPAGTSQTLAPSLSSTVFGQPVTLTATVTAIGTPMVATGTVDFLGPGGVPVASGVALDGTGTASIVVNSPPFGSDGYTSVYHAGVGFTAGADGSTTVNVGAAPTTTGLLASPATTVSGQTVTLTATVTVGGASLATPTGSILFADGSGYAQTVALIPAGTGTAIAVATPSALGVGVHAITATYLPDAGFSVSASSPSTVTVSTAGTTTVLGVSPATYSEYGQAVTLTATVAANAPAAGVPTGNVEFFDGATDLGGQSPDGSGVATLTITLPAAGAHSWSASYGGDGAYASSAAAPIAYTVYAARTDLSASVSGTQVYGSPVTVSAHVVALDGTAVVGPVTFRALPANVLLGSANVDGSGNASLTSSTIPGNTTDVLVVFDNPPQFQSSGRDLAVVMARATPQLQVSINPNPGVFFGTVTVQVTLTGVNPTDVPQGFVTPYIDGNSIGFDVVDATGVDSRNIQSPAVGQHSLRASYNGNLNYAPVSQYAQGAVQFTINGADPGLTLTSSPDPAGIGSPFTLTATVTPSNFHTPQGTVDFLETSGGLYLLGSATIGANGTASTTFTWPLGGTLNLRAVYTSSDAFFASTSVDRTLVVMRLPTTTVVGVNTTPPWLANQPLTLAAFVSSTAPVTGGTVSFYDGATYLGTGALNGAIATTTATFAAGNHAITAGFSGSNGFAGSVSAIATVPIAAHPSATTLSILPATPIVNQNAQVTVAVAATDGAIGFPSGPVTVTDGTQVCQKTAPQGICNFSWSTPGVVNLTATFAGDTLLGPSTANLSFNVVKETPILLASDDLGATWVTGNTVLVNWSLPFNTPAPTGTVSALNSNHQGCVNQPVSGSCAVLIPGTGSQTITVTYSGDSQYASATQLVTGVALACHLFSVNASPSSFGSFEILPAPNCASGRGYPDGSSVIILPRPTAHHQFTAFDGYPGQSFLQLTITQDTFLIGRFDYICDVVNVAYVPKAQWYPVTNTDCGPISQNPNDHTVYLPYRDGDTVTLQGDDYTDPTYGLYSFDSWSVYNGPSSAGRTYSFTAVPGLYIFPVLVRPCYQVGMSYNDPAGGSARSHVGAYGGGGATCLRPDGSGGFHYGDQVYVSVTENITMTHVNQGGYAYSYMSNPSYNISGIRLTGTDQAGGLTGGASYGGGAVYTFHVHGDNAVSINFAACHQVRTDTNPTFPVFVNNKAVSPGSVATSGTNCHDNTGYTAFGWYAGPVTVTATAGAGFQFYTWRGDTSSGLTPPLPLTVASATVTLDGSADHHLTATFGAPNSCYPAPLEVGALKWDLPTLEKGWLGAVPTTPYGSLSVDATTPEHTNGHGYCPPGMYEAGSTIMIDANANSGIFTGFMARRIGYNADGTLNNYNTNLVGPLGYDGSPLSGSEISRPQSQIFVVLPPAGGGAVAGIQAWFCYPVDLTQVALAPSGTAFLPPLPMVGWDSATSDNQCPVAPSTFLPGTTVKATEHATPGYTFKDWEGSIGGTSAGITAVANQPLNLNAVFNGACYSLNVNAVYTSGSPGPAGEIRSDDPNCPGFDAARGMYLAGTVVALQAADKGSQEPFEGWSGADSGNGLLGIVTMNSDRTLHALYNDDLNHPLASASAFGTYMSAVGKTTVGLLATAISSYVINFTSAGLLGLVGTIGSSLGAIGVPYAGAIGSIFSNISSTLTGPLDCVGTWGLNNGGSGGNAYTQGAAYGKTAGSTANTVGNTAKGEGALGGLTQKIDSIKNFTAANADTLSDAQKTGYALKWIALGVQVGMQLTTASVNADWSMGSFESSMSSCLSNKGNNLSTSVTGL